MVLNPYKKFFTLCTLTFTVTFCLQLDPSEVLLVSFDGFRWDYIYKFPTLNFHRLIEDGVYVKQVSNVFITKTYPNHYSMVTGLYAENHGIVANEMYDPVLNKTFSMDTLDIYDSEFWEEAVPIWITNQNEGHKSGVAMWPGSDVNISGVYPSFYLPYNELVSFEYRVAKLIEWFTSNEPINLGLLYWEEPDDSAHLLGPDNPFMSKVIKEVDEKLGYLVAEMKKAGLWDTVNLIVTSDHGMEQCSSDRVIELDNYVDENLYTLVDRSPTVAILPKEGKLEDVYEALANAHPNMTVYKKEDIPERFHYIHNSRIQPILAVADLGWTILQSRSGGYLEGNHGYDNTEPNMHPLLLAHGPAFKRNVTKEAMNLTDLYPLLCHLLDIQPLPNNGSLSQVQDLLASTDPPFLSNYVDPESYASFVGVFLGSVLALAFLLIFIKHVTRSQMSAPEVEHPEITQPLLDV
uniref:Ectonucleotide pyrophosphatase/phosphodiesterase family member 5 n=1 Tax=Geotrypetes seraphini TaxID=260995 RepID=A0A6P8QBP4_GEOSA|nr:ectonucleotide pyrophosphatase/phosphodiesterase family member 5 [Geotrypetes seraphini]XP_033793226.1 ectonucleotide pyrophosphatase/phosphodiesterase family member 5 [Geotrypetes seraphini]XP_033793227.1 ectonucleotide pyrophosphatase/phosphodiesterase family member 5 [Geotrypetes seraphini]XP_033793228.1 ectonucleotide pyrophosphatase/phosphodiesterase family member 5 [Geotrypetes seraphini]XP_033793229.1 ectonucleotide pyrophosphatase/phosphodiesterase family member 5 [Geotrypetes seraph